MQVHMKGQKQNSRLQIKEKVKEGNYKGNKIR